MKKFAWIFPVMAGILWGSAGLFIRTLSAYGMNTTTIVSSRSIIAVFMILIWILIKDKTQLKIKLKDLWIFVLAAWLGMLGVNIAYNESVNYVNLSLAAVLLSMSPVYVLVLARIFFKEKITLRKAGCGVFAIAGCVLASGLVENLGGMKISGYGMMLGVASGIFYAMYSMFSKIAMKRGYSGLTITFYCILVIAITLIPFTDWNIIGKYICDAPAKGSLIMVLHALCCAALPYAFYTIGFQFMEAGKVSILAADEPVAAMVFGILFFSEIPTLIEFAGLVITIVAIIILGMPEKKKA